MLVILSPSKNLHNQPRESRHFTLPRFPEETNILIGALKKQTPRSLQKLMEINDKLAKLNVERYHQFSWPHSSQNATVALYTFRGEVYLGLDANTMSPSVAEEANKHIRILSGLYGILRPFDLIQPYRLEMGTELKIGKAKNLYEFWGNKITMMLNQDALETKSKEIINLASLEYTAAINKELLKVPLVEIKFLENRNGRLQFLSFNAKRSRGWMARYIIENKVKKSADLKAFDLQGYGFREDLSNKQEMVFVR